MLRLITLSRARHIEYRLRQLEAKMAAFDDLNTLVTTINTKVDALIAQMGDMVNAQQVSALKTGLQGIVDKLTPLVP